MKNFFVVDSNNILKGSAFLDDFLEVTLPANFVQTNMTPETAWFGVMQYDRTAGVLVPYVPPVRVISKLEFDNRFTFQELAAMVEAKKTDAEVEALDRKIQMAPNINLEDPLVAFGLDVLISKGLLASGRKAEILA
jgi:hypothetical protein